MLRRRLRTFANAFLTVAVVVSPLAVNGTAIARPGLAGPAPLAATAGSELSVTGPGLRATVEPTGGIGSLTFPDGRSWQLGGRSLVAEGTSPTAGDACAPDGDAHPTGHGGAAWRTRCTDGQGRTTLLTESLVPTDSSLSWTVQVSSASGTYSKGIWTDLSGWQDGHTRKFWTTWSDSGVLGAGDWSDPLAPAPFADRSLAFGIVSPSGFSVPVASIIEPDTDHAVSLVQSPEDVVVSATLSTTSGGTVRLGRFNNRITTDRPVAFHLDLVPTEADWRPALGWVTQHYPQYFGQMVSDRSTEGLGSYSPYPGPFSDSLRAKLSGEDFRTNWELSLRGPYQGEFVPPVASADETWEPDLGTFWPQTPDTQNVAGWRRTLGYWQDAGLTNLAYFNASLFGSYIKDPAPPRQYSCQDPDRWKSANDHLYCDFPDAVLRRADGTAVFDWRSGVVMDPGDPAYQQHLVDQATALMTQLPQYSGLAVDQFSHYRSINVHADDGVTWYGDQPARSLITSWKDLSPKLTAAVHRLGKQIWGNSHSDTRIDLFKDLDGIFTEGVASTGYLSMNGFLALERPVVAWMNSLGADPDALLQRCLYLGVYPMADAPVNDHGIHTSPTVAGYYADYGAMFKALVGKKWVYRPHAVEVTSGVASANVFSVDDGVVVPVVGGGDDVTAGLELRGLQQIRPDLDLAHAEVLYPGRTGWQSLAVARHGNVVTTTVPLQRGAALIRFRPDREAGSRPPPGSPLTMHLSSTGRAVGDADPTTFSARVVNPTRRTVTGVTAQIEVPNGWVARPMAQLPDSLPPAGSATASWTLTSPAAAAGSVGEVRVRVRSGPGRPTTELSDARRLVAGKLVPAGDLTASAPSQQPGYPAQNAVDGDDGTQWRTAAATSGSSITLDLHGEHHLAGLTYLPGQDGSVDGWVDDYAVDVSTDGVTFRRVTDGSWGFDAGLESARFDASNVRYVKLTNASRSCPTAAVPPTGAAEIGVIEAPGGSGAAASGTGPTRTGSATAEDPPFAKLVPHSAMTATATSQQNGYPASKAIDDSPCTIWHIQYSPYLPLPQSITLDLGTAYDTTGIAYIPRQDFDNGQITEYQASTSQDGQTFTPAAAGFWPPTSDQKVVSWAPTTARYVRLTAITGNGASAAYPQGLASAGNLEVGYQ